MSTAQEATINPDGTTNVPPTGTEDETFTNNSTFTAEEIPIPKTTDPALYLGLIVLVIAIISFFIYRKRKNKVEDDGEEFFQQLDGEKVISFISLDFIFKKCSRL